MARPRTVLAVTCASLCAAGVLAVPAVSGSAGAAPNAHPAQHKIIPGSPNAYTEHMYYTPGGLRFVVWAIDPDAKKTALTVYVVVDGSKIGQFVADQPRPDIAATHHAAGPNH